MAILIVGVFRGRDQAEGALRELRNRGFEASEIGLALHGESARTAGTVQAPASSTFAWIPNHHASSLRGIGNALVAGTVADCIDKEFPGQTQASLADALACMGVQREHADWYDQKVREGSDLVVVRTDSRGAEAQEVMERFGTLEVPSGGRTSGVPRPPTSSTSALSATTAAGLAMSSAPRGGQGPVSDFSQVKAGFDVFTSDGRKIGTVQETSTQCVHVLSCSNLFVQPSRVRQVTNDSIVLNASQDQLSDFDWSTCHPSHREQFESGGPGYSGLPPQEHEPGVNIPVEPRDV